MAGKTKVREITITSERGTFATIFKKLYGEGDDYDFEGLSALRNLLSNEKARLLHIIKTKKPVSIYQLAKLSGRNFKSVSDDIKVLERFGFVDLIEEKSGKRERLKPVVVIDSLILNIKV